MKTGHHSEEATTNTEWTPERILSCGSPYYPLSESGRLCPILNDKDLLHQFYVDGDLRQHVKRFCRTHRWPGKPPSTYAITDDVLRALLSSMLNSPEARQLLDRASSHLALHNAIWAWLSHTNQGLYAAAQRVAHKDEAGRYFMNPTELRTLLNEYGSKNAAQLNCPLFFLGLAFAMLQPESRPELLAEILKDYPDAAVGLGLSLSAEQTVESNPSQAPAGSAIDTSQSSRERDAAPQRDSAYESEGSDEVYCWAASVSRIFSRLDELLEASRQLKESAARLAEIECVTAFRDDGEACSLVEIIASARQSITAGCKDLFALIKIRCVDSDCAPCGLAQLLRQMDEKSITSIADFALRVDAMREKSEQLHKKAQGAREQLNSLHAEAETLRGILQVGRTATATRPADPLRHPCSFLNSLAQQKGMVTELQKLLSAEVLRRKGLLLSESERIRKQYDLDTGAAFRRCAELHSDLQDLAEHIEDIADLHTAEQMLDELKDACLRAEAQDYRKVAGTLRKAPQSFGAFLDLCSGLIAEGAGSVAFLLFHLRQHLYPLEEIAEDPVRTLSMLLEATCGANNEGMPVATLWGALLTGPWMLGIEQQDIESADLIERIVVCLLGAALSFDRDQAASSLVRLGGLESAGQRLPSLLVEILQAVITQREWRILNAEDVEKDARLGQRLSEQIAFEHGRYRHLQCGNAPRFARFETVAVFPALKQLHAELIGHLSAHRFEKARQRLEGIEVQEWYSELVRERDRTLDEHPHFSGKIRSFMATFVDMLHEYLEVASQVGGGGQLVFSGEQFDDAVNTWAGDQAARKIVVRLVESSLPKKSTEGRQAISIWHAVMTTPAVIRLCPQFVLWLNQQEEPRASQQAEDVLLADLASTRSLVEIAQSLQEAGAWDALIILDADLDSQEGSVWKVQRQRALDEMRSRRTEVKKHREAEDLAAFDKCIAEGRYAAAQSILRRCEKDEAEARDRSHRRLGEMCQKALEALGEIKDVAFIANMPPEWLDEIMRFATRIEMELRRLKLSSSSGTFGSVSSENLFAAVEALEFVVEQQTNVFVELDYLLKPATITDSNPHGTNGQHAPGADPSVEGALKGCHELRAAWDALSTDTQGGQGETQRTWARFVKEFAIACNLYHGGYDAARRFKTVPSIQYPFTVYETAFYKPQSEFLKRSLRLYLYKQKEVDAPALRRLEAELTTEDAAAWLHIVFAPQGFARIQEYFNYRATFRDFLLADSDFVQRVSRAERHDVPVRQALHASVADLSISTPFVAQGYCHQSNNIYVGRKDVLQKLINTPQAMIWGGRRIGKTSVLHALETALHNRQYRVAYVYVDIEDEGDPDLAVARKVSACFEMEPPASITEFERQMTALRSEGVRLAFLIDEVDEYIKKSRSKSGDAFPLATALRQLVMDDSKRDTRLVYSGYHQLFYEARLYGGPRRAAHPFINIAQDIPIGNLSVDEVNDLLTIGFRDMLGIEIAPDVPGRVYRAASGHPAFVQYFCRCLLDRVSVRRSRGASIVINRDDVEQVYMTNGEKAFISYVNETLGYNLTHLGRAVMLVVCDVCRRGGDTTSEYYFTKSEVRDELAGWCDVEKVECPDPGHFAQTVELLVMTNLLTEHRTDQDRYRVTYPAYVDFLHRLDKLGKIPIGKSLREYDEKQRKTGVLL